MHISLEGEIGIVLALIGLGGAGAIMIAPTHILIGWTLIAVFLVGAVTLSLYHVSDRLPYHGQAMIGVMLVCGAGLIGSAAAYFWPQAEEQSRDQFSESARPLNSSIWTSVLDLADQLRREIDGTPLAKTVAAIGDSRSDVLAFYANLLNDNAQLYGIMPPSPTSEAINIKGKEKIRFIVNGGQMDSTDPSSKPLYRFIHLRTQDVSAALAKVKGLATTQNAYSYGLSLDSLAGEIDQQRSNLNMSWKLGITNRTNEALKFRVEHMQFRIGGAAVPSPDFEPFGGVIPKGAATLAMYRVESDAQLTSFSNESEAVLEYSIVYGSPSGPFLRRWKRLLSITHFKPEPNTNLTYTIISESDEPY